MPQTRYTLSTPQGSSALAPHLLVSIAWCTRTLKWKALQCSLPPSSGHGSHPSAAWDVVFDDESFQPLLPGCLSEPSRQQLLTVLSRQGRGATTATPATAAATGATGATASLHELLDVLLRLYLEHQRAQLELASTRNARLQFELSTLPETDGLQLQYIPATGSEAAKACISIPLEGLDTATLAAAANGDGTPAVPTASSSGAGSQADVFRLCATFKLTDSNIDPELQLQAPPYAASWLASVPLPPWSHHMCLMEYIPMLVDKTQTALGGAAAALNAKHAFFEALNQVFGAPLDYCRSAACAMYSLQYEQAPVLLHVDASAGQFPDEKPLLSVSSVRLLGLGPEGSKVYRDYPWSPRWSAAEKAARIHNYLKAELPLFLRTKNPIAVNATTAAPAAPVIGLPAPGGV